MAVSTRGGRRLVKACGVGSSAGCEWAGFSQFWMDGGKI
jgi:hypothetical protein